MNERNFKLPEFSTEGADSRAHPSSRRDVLESAKLSRLPERKPFNLPDFPFPKPSAITCIGCAGRIETDNEFQQSIKVCRKCLVHYAKIETAIEEAEKRKRKETLERFALEVKR
ncbi:MAG: hypothetical protein M3388_16760 [Acidobacteriota bacterium]|nr:hypothetical protein [Acidobacteriota bacterium]